MDLIINCVSLVTYNVLWNGSKNEFFFPKRSLRQWIPISPLLFVICMDKLSHIICDVVEDSSWKPIYVFRAGPKVSHLMFSDDLLLFGVAFVNQVECMMRCP